MRAPDDLAPDLRRLTAPNPSPMTSDGTQTYLLGTESLAVIDPGPDDRAHLAAILSAVPAGARISHILITHAHLDHSAGAPALARATGAPILSFGGATEGRSPEMQELAGRKGLLGGEGIDPGFTPDQRLRHGDAVAGQGWRLRAHHTPGHLSSHLSFALEGRDIVFTGDTVMGWSTTLISPPDGSVGAFLGALDHLMGLEERRYLPGHGAAVDDGPALAATQKAHRLARSAQILDALREGQATLESITEAIYRDVPRHLHRAAARNVLAHLIDLAQSGRVAMPADDLSTGDFRAL
ncbi:MBL fold metallo-hydrolase [Oceanibium sediminis]|uniref:MBL fold metallo-hydrolase n=1 Tax=Oceanibium sediminis TaxID=2026339 RepID=UPI000DD4818C|nr:MBL fold metallo-hydrolase [Oceanibium sediminis]